MSVSELSPFIFGDTLVSHLQDANRRVGQRIMPAAMESQRAQGRPLLGRGDEDPHLTRTVGPFTGLGVRLA